jgi:pilus assembly protein Flp/PilA
MKKILEFIRDERGATAIEYSMIGGIVSIVILAGVLSMGSSTNSRFSAFADALK